MNNYFTILHTNTVKGVAIILMLIHHLFYDSNALRNFIFLFGQEESIFLMGLSYVSKVCVALFTILSGYGMHRSFSLSKKRILVFTKEHIQKLIYLY